MSTQQARFPAISRFLHWLIAIKGLGVAVIDIKVAADDLLKFNVAAVSAATNLFLGQLRKPAFDLVEPGSRGGCEVHVKASVTSQPSFDRNDFVSAVGVHDQMHVQLRRHRLFNGAQKLQEFPGPMPPMQLADHFTGGDVQGCEQRGRAVAGVVMGASLRPGSWRAPLNASTRGVRQRPFSRSKRPHALRPAMPRFITIWDFSGCRRGGCPRRSRRCGPR
jgi:hypothetical protein